MITRRSTPYVPILEGVPVPSPTKFAEENTQYFSVFFRPWTLHEPRDDIPHLCSLAHPTVLPPPSREFKHRASFAATCRQSSGDAIQTCVATVYPW